MSENQLKTDLKDSLEGLKQKAKHSADKRTARKGWVLFFYNEDHLVARLKSLSHIPPVLTSSETQESFDRGKPAFFLYELPVWICISGIPHTFELEFHSVKEEREILREHGYTAEEIYSKIHSVFKNELWDSRALDKKYYILLLICCALSSSLTALVMSLAFGGMF